MGAFFSIIIPVYNGAGKIPRALDSILRQSFGDLEVLVVDGGSKDDTVKVASAYGDPRIRITSGKDKGIYDAMNKGIDLAGGQWLYFMGADDELHDSGVLAAIAAAAGAGGRDVIYGDVRIIGATVWAKDGDRYDGPFDLKRLLQKNICHQSLFYRRSFIKERIGYYNIEYRICADWDFNLKCRANASFHYLDLLVANFYAGGESTQSQDDPKFSDEYVQNIITYFGVTPFDPMINDPGFIQFHKVCSLQKKENYLRYLTFKIRRRLSKSA